MKMKVLLFGPFVDAAGSSCVEVDMPANGPETAGHLMALLAEQQPKLRGMLEGARLAVNCQCVEPRTMVRPTDELALVGMVSGG